MTRYEYNVSGIYDCMVEVSNKNIDDIENDVYDYIDEYGYSKISKLDILDTNGFCNFYMNLSVMINNITMDLNLITLYEDLNNIINNKRIIKTCNKKALSFIIVLNGLIGDNKETITYTMNQYYEDEELYKELYELSESYLEEY